MNRPRLLAYSAVLTVVCGMGFALVYGLTVRTRPGRQFGDASLRGAQLTESGVAGAVDTVLGVVSVATLLAGIAAIALLALTRLQRVPGVVAVGLVVAANGSTWLLKTQVLSRPDLGLSEVTPATHNSLPSGHTTAVFSVAVALLLVAPVRWRAPLAVVGGTASVVMAVATMSAGWHRAGDSMAAFALVGFWAGLAMLLIVALGPDTATSTAQASQTSRVPRRWFVAATGGCTGVAVGLAAGLVLIRPLRTSPAGATLAFFAGGLFIVGAAVLVLTGVRLVLARSGH